MKTGKKDKHGIDMKPLTILLTLLSLTAYSQELPDDVLIHDSAETAAMEMAIQNGIFLIETGCNKIRVVVHVVHDGANGQISEQQVLSQIRYTNMVLRNDSLGYNEGNHALGYEIELARTDPDGHPTDGIIYTDGTALFGSAWHTYGLRNTNNSAISAGTLASALAWGADTDGKKYLNCYVVPKIDGNSGSGVQAYAWMPTSSIVFGNYNLSNTFGRGAGFNLKSYTNQGKTFTHELFHNFALYHVFEGNSCEPETNPLLQGDRCVDTPPQTKGVGCYGACGFISYNIMDYLSQTCKYLITQDQVGRAAKAINFSLIDYIVCPPCKKSADINGDGVVNIRDVSLFSAAFGTTDEAADLNCDGVVNVLDFSILSDAFGTIIVPTGAQISGYIYYDITGRVVRGNVSEGLYILQNNNIVFKAIAKDGR